MIPDKVQTIGNKEESEVPSEHFADMATTAELRTLVMEVANYIVDHPDFKPDLLLLQQLTCRDAYETPRPENYTGTTENVFAKNFNVIPWQGVKPSIARDPEDVEFPPEDEYRDKIWMKLMPESEDFPRGVAYGFDHSPNSNSEDLHTGIKEVLETLIRRADPEVLYDYFLWFLSNSKHLLPLMFTEDTYGIKLFFQRNNLGEAAVLILRKILEENAPCLYPQLRDYYVGSFISSIAQDELGITGEENEETALLMQLAKEGYTRSQDRNGILNSLFWPEEEDGSEPVALILSEDPAVVRKAAQEFLVRYHRFEHPSEIISILNSLREAYLFGIKGEELEKMDRASSEELADLKEELEVRYPEKIAISRIAKYILFGDPLDIRPFHIKLDHIYQISNFSKYPLSAEAKNFRGNMLHDIFSDLGLNPEETCIFSLGVGDFWTEEDLFRLGYDVYGLEISSANIEMAEERIKVMWREVEGEEIDPEILEQFIKQANWDELSNWETLQQLRQLSDKKRVFVITGRSLSHEEREEVFEATMFNFYANMEPGDYLIFDMPDPETGSYKTDRDAFRSRLMELGAAEETARQVDYLVDGPDEVNCYNRFVPDEQHIVELARKAGLEVVNPLHELEGIQSKYKKYIDRATDSSIKEFISSDSEDGRRNMFFIFQKPLDAPPSKPFAPLRQILTAT